MKIVRYCLIVLLSTSCFLLNAAQGTKKRKYAALAAAHTATHLVVKKPRTDNSAAASAAPSSISAPAISAPAAQSFDPQTLLIASLWKSHIQDYVDAKACTVLSEHKEFVYAVRFSPDGDRMAS